MTNGYPERLGSVSPPERFPDPYITQRFKIPDDQQADLGFNL